ncbi:carbohydrate sulfotransferase 12 [Lingula anatina]|uniref:Carbohydrate sulfotransferase n=1 Tax=Lingula anatina TaxID=7574 RepID=A0A1S3I9S3_LINAN|nr:carbohydrate sulfotransferase 12 [Lingula anatina]|eukprot:XP_013394923.1 carbohydrate sulfotransferase 12 [Lingula anatina]
MRSEKALVNFVLGVRGRLMRDTTHLKVEEKVDQLEATTISIQDIMAMMGNGQSENDQQSELDDDVIPEEWLEEIRRRKKLVSEACEKFKTVKIPLTKEWIEENGDHLIVEDQYKIIYCRVPKSGNTSWKRLLLALSGIINDTSMAHGKNGLNPRDSVEKYLHTLDTLSFSEAKQKLKTHLKVMYLRHPLERLLSAYRNKLERDPWTHDGVSSQVVPYVMKHYRGVEPILPVSVSQSRGRISGVLPSGEEFSFPKDKPPSWYVDTCSLTTAPLIVSIAHSARGPTLHDTCTVKTVFSSLTHF